MRLHVLLIVKCSCWRSGARGYSGRTLRRSRAPCVDWDLLEGVYAAGRRCYHYHCCYGLLPGPLTARDGESAGQHRQHQHDRTQALRDVWWWWGWWWGQGAGWGGLGGVSACALGV